MFPHHPGEWLLTHQAFSPQGEALGHITAQHQVVDNHIHQEYTPHITIAEHPLTTLHGSYSHQFEAGQGVLTFTGHDFTGTGHPYNAHLTMFRGLMTRFGYHVHSQLIQPAEDIILGVTYLTSALQPVATLVTVGARGTSAPEFSGPRWSSALALRWAGTYHGTSPEPLTRRATGLRVEEQTESHKVITWELETWAPDAIVSGSITGLARVTGHMLTIEAMQGPLTRLELTEIIHPPSEWLVSLRRWYTAQHLKRTELVLLQPA